MAVLKTLFLKSTGPRYYITPTSKNWPATRESKECTTRWGDHTTGHSYLQMYAVWFRGASRAEDTSRTWSVSTYWSCFFVGSSSICGCRYPWAAYAEKARKPVYSRDNRPFLKADTGDLSDKDYCTERSHGGLETLGYTLWGLRNCSRRQWQAVHVHVLCNVGRFCLNKTGYEY